MRLDSRAINWTWGATALLGVVLLSACSGDPDDSGGIGSAGSNNGSSTSMDDDPTTELDVAGATDDEFELSAACVSEVVQGEGVPLDMYILFDQSGSMVTPVGEGVTRLDAVREAAHQFLEDSKTQGLGVGLGYFGNMPIGSTSCDPEDYRTPAVGFGNLPDHATALLASLDAAQPTGETPTGAAIRGACDYVGQWRAQHTIRSTVMLLVTDGIPEAPVSSMQNGCTPDLPDAVDAASECSASGTPIYVLGVGPNLNNLVQIAEAGGTEQAYLVGDEDVSQQVLAALNTIRNSAIPCDFLIPDAPEGESIDFDYFNVISTDRQSQTSPVPYVESDGDCADGGWYLDDVNAPSQVHLCRSTCDQITAEGASFQYAFGCERRTIIR